MNWKRILKVTLSVSLLAFATSHLDLETAGQFLSESTQSVILLIATGLILHVALLAYRWALIVESNHEEDLAKTTCITH